MSKSKKILFAFVMLLCLFFPVLEGCSFTTKLASPELTLFRSDYCLSFHSVAGTKTYNIFCNNELLEEYENSDDSSTILYDFSEALTTDGKYKFYVVAVSDSLYLKDSEPSNEVEFNYFKVSLPAIPQVTEKETELNFSINKNGMISFTPVFDNNISYALYLYSNSTGLQTYPVTSSTINLTSGDYNLKHEIYAVRLGYFDGEYNYVSSTLKFYNPDNCEGYTDKIYIFDGYIHDYYITSLNELNNIMYYTYINRIEQFAIKLSDSMQEDIINSFVGASLVEKMNNAIIYSMDTYYETQNYMPGHTGNKYVQQVANSMATEFNIYVSYFGITECNESISPSQSAVYKQGDTTGYYDRVDYEMLGENYDNFISDHYFLTTKCSTSEQLYWAVENKVTPIVVKGSRAEIIYNKAKDVLREIISPEMSDYEKALSIFDWICINTNYDYTDYDNISSGGIALGALPMQLPCFYLEGVFNTGYSVCDGFSKAYSLMCNMVGVDCIRIVGKATANGQTGGHAWNKVFIDKDGEGGDDGQYYLVDITWTEILTAEDEVMSHMYFLKSDAEVAGTHETFSDRHKFNYYVADENYYYYKNDKFTYYNNETHLSTEYNWVMENDTEMRDAFYYALDNSLESIEFIIDLDYMIEYYEIKYGPGSYGASNKVDIKRDALDRIISKYDHKTDTLTLYTYGYGMSREQTYPYYKLREEFMECMRGLKFNEQGFSVIDYDGVFVYGSDGSDIGILYILEQGLRIDDRFEAAHLFEYLSNSNILGKYELSVDSTLLTDYSGTSYVTKLVSLISQVIGTTDLEYQLQHLGEDEGMQIFNLIITEN